MVRRLDGYVLNYNLVFVLAAFDLVMRTVLRCIYVNSVGRHSGNCV